MIPSQVTQDLEDTLIPWKLVGSCAVEHIYNETAMHAKATASNYLAKAKKKQVMFQE